MRDADLVADLLVVLRDAGIHLSELSVQKPTLDEVFLTLTGHGVDASTELSDRDPDAAAGVELEGSLA
jgi:ABC-2 type transport system ATP-binding protein